MATAYPEATREQFLEQPLPSSPDSERVILGAILLDNELITQAIEKISADDFYSPNNRRIFKAMTTLFEKGERIDPILIGEELKKDGSIDSIGGVATITNLTYGLPHFSDIFDYTKVVKNKAMIAQSHQSLQSNYQRSTRRRRRRGDNSRPRRADDFRARRRENQTGIFARSADCRNGSGKSAGICQTRIARADRTFHRLSRFGRKNFRFTAERFNHRRSASINGENCALSDFGAKRRDFGKRGRGGFFARNVERAACDAYAQFRRRELTRTVFAPAI